MKAALISLGSKSSQWTAEAMSDYFKEIDIINVKNIEINLGVKEPILHNGQPIKEYDCVYVKGSFRYANLLSSISSILYGKVYLPFEPRAFNIAHNKVMTHLELQRQEIPMPKTYLSSTPDAAKKILKKINYPIVFKFPEGTQGKGVMFADSYASASSVLDALGALKQPFIIQEYIETGGTDIRAIVVGEEVIAAMQRKAQAAEHRANIHAGGEGKAVKLDRQAKKIAVDTAKAIGADICGVDLLESAKGPVVLEANISPGLQGITKFSGVNVADKIAKFLVEKTKEFKGMTKKITAAELVGEKEGEKQEVITPLTFRANRILLPEIATKVTGFKEDKDYSLKVEKGKLIVEKH